MEHKRQRVQFGWLDLKKKKERPEVWVVRYGESLADGSKRVPSLIVGSIEAVIQFGYMLRAVLGRQFY